MFLVQLAIDHWKGITMNMLKVWLGPLVGLLAAAGIAQAWYRAPAFKTPLGYAPDACGPGFYTVCPNGYCYGPNYCLYPPSQPFNGLLPPDKAKQLGELQGRGIQQPPFAQGYTPPGGPAPGYTPYGVPLPNPGYNPPLPEQQPAGFPSHPFARSPRDFFMWSDVMQDRMARAQRPALVP
jgi:hypothetical protein